MSDSIPKKRKNEISYLNILFCIIVIFIHACAEPMQQYQLNSLPYYGTMSLYRLSSFVVQGFIFLSGVKLFLNLKEPYDHVGAWLKQFKRIVLPYVLWVCIYFGYFANIGWEIFRFKTLAKYIAVGNLSAHFYFVVVIVQFYLLAPLFVKLVKRLRPAILLPAAFVLMIFMWQYLPDILNKVLTLTDLEVINYPIRVYLNYIDRIFTSYLFYFILGMVAGRFYESFMAGLRKSGFVVAFTFGIFACGDLFSYVLIRNFWYRFTEIYHVFYCISAILFALYMVDLITRHLPERMPRFVRAADNATYLVYLIHLLVMRIIRGEMDERGIVSVTLRFGGAFVLTVTVSFACVMLWQLVAKKYNERLNKVIKQ